TSPNTTFISNLIGSGRGQSRYFVFNNTANCFVAMQANNKNNYFWMGASPVTTIPDAVYQLTGGTSGSTLPNGNLVDTAHTNGCYDPVAVQPDYHTLGTSACVNAGLTGNRKDATAITKDVDNASRTLGSAPDIGCSEKQ